LKIKIINYKTTCKSQAIDAQNQFISKYSTSNINKNKIIACFISIFSHFQIADTNELTS